MRWDIFGNQKLLELKERMKILSADIQVLKNSLEVQTKSIFAELQILSLKIDEFQSKQIVEIPLVKPIIRDAERAMKKEKQEPEAINMWKN